MIHQEQHFRAPETVRDIIIGMSDGLTVPFAIAAGLSGAMAESSIIVIAGLAEMAAGSISMALGGYLAAQSNIDNFRTEEAREYSEIRNNPEEEKNEVVAILRGWGMKETDCKNIIDDLVKHPDAWVDFMMKFELKLEKPDAGRAIVSALTIGLSYIAGGALPLSPYIFVAHPAAALRISILVTGLALLIFGGLKGYFTGVNPIKASIQTAIVGGLAAGAAFALARVVS